jgi:hypothetical protein
MPGRSEKAGRPFGNAAAIAAIGRSLSAGHYGPDIRGLAAALAWRPTKGGPVDGSPAGGRKYQGYPCAGRIDLSHGRGGLGWLIQ